MLRICASFVLIRIRFVTHRWVWHKQSHPDWLNMSLLLLFTNAMVTRRQKDWLDRGKKKKPVVTESLSHTSVQTVAKESWCTVCYEQIFDSKVRWGPQHLALNLNFLTTVSASVFLSFFGCFHLSDIPWWMLSEHLKVFIKMYRLHLKNPYFW